jgi:hypothetical protein
MTTYRVFYEFLEKPEEFVVKADNSFIKSETPWGQGELDGELAYIPETEAEWKNLSREIAKHYNYHSVNVTRILPLSLSGQLVVDSE